MPTTDDDLPAAPTPALPPVTPGKSATEWWATIIAVGGPIAAYVVNAIITSGKVQEGTPWHSVLLILAAVLAAMGYTAVRGGLKIAQQWAASAIVVAKLNHDAEVVRLRRASLEYRQAA